MIGQRAAPIALRRGVLLLSKSPPLRYRLRDYHNEGEGKVGEVGGGAEGGRRQGPGQIVILGS